MLRNNYEDLLLCELTVFFFFSGVLSYNHQGLPDALMNQPLPRILSRGETFRAAIGERIILPCQVKDLGK